MPIRTIKQTVLAWLRKTGYKYLVDETRMRQIVQEEMRKSVAKHLTEHAQRMVNALGGGGQRNAK